MVSTLRRCDCTQVNDLTSQEALAAKERTVRNRRSSQATKLRKLNHKKRSWNAQDRTAKWKFAQRQAMELSLRQVTRMSWASLYDAVGGPPEPRQFRRTDSSPSSSLVECHAARELLSLSADGAVPERDQECMWNSDQRPATHAASKLAASREAAFVRG